MPTALQCDSHIRLSPPSRPPAIDYIVTIGPGYDSTALIQRDQTVFVADPAYFGSLVIEGGAVFKSPNTYGGTAPTSTSIEVQGTLQRKASGNVSKMPAELSFPRRNSSHRTVQVPRVRRGASRTALEVFQR